MRSTCSNNTGAVLDLLQDDQYVDVLGEIRAKLTQNSQDILALQSALAEKVKEREQLDAELARRTEIVLGGECRPASMISPR
jgi:predicted ATP-dependent serine protease